MCSRLARMHSWARRVGVRNPEAQRATRDEQRTTYLCGDFLEDLLLRLWTFSARAVFFLVEAILCRDRSAGTCAGKEYLRGETGVLQKLFRMRAALSLSLSSVVGQNASDP